MTVEVLEEQESGLRAVDVGSRISTPSSSPFQTQRSVCNYLIFEFRLRFSCCGWCLSVIINRATNNYREPLWQVRSQVQVPTCGVAFPLCGVGTAGSSFINKEFETRQRQEWIQSLSQ